MAAPWVFRGKHSARLARAPQLSLAAEEVEFAA